MTKADRQQAKAFHNVLTADGRKPATYFYVTMEGGRVAVKYDGTSGGEITKFIRSYEQYTDFMRSKRAECVRHGGTALANEMQVLFSSSIDFVHEYTQNEDVIALAHKLRGG